MWLYPKITHPTITRQPLLCCCNGSDRPVLRRCTGHYASIPCWVLPGACGDVCGKRNVPGAAVQKSVRNVQMKHPLTCRVTMALTVTSHAALLRTRGSPPTAATAAICRRRRISRRCAWWHRRGLLQYLRFTLSSQPFLQQSRVALLERTL